MRRFSLMALLLSSSASMVIIYLLTVLIRQSNLYDGSTQDIGNGFHKAFHVEDLDSNEIGNIRVSVDKSIAERQPAWKWSASNPPLSARRALEIAGTYRKTRLKQWDRFEWTLVSLNLTPMDARNGKWCWVARFELAPKPGLTATHMPELDFYILMDGTVVEPEVSNDYLIDPASRIKE